jgi:hypothetical protein
MQRNTGPCEGKGSDEQTLLRGLLDRLAHGDILLGDSFFPTYFLLCDLIRLLMAQGALLADQIPRQLSFKHTVQVRVSWQQRGGETYVGVCIRRLLLLTARPRVGLRSGRIEPRV